MVDLPHRNNTMHMTAVSPREATKNSPQIPQQPHAHTHTHTHQATPREREIESIPMHAPWIEHKMGLSIECSVRKGR